MSIGRLRRAAGVSLVATAISIGMAAAVSRAGKTLFRAQPLAWDPDFRGTGKVEPITLSPAWTFSDLRAPLAGDPLAVDGRLVAATQDGELVSLDQTGAVLWRTRLGGPIGVGPAGGDHVLFQATRAGDLAAVSAADGRVLWRQALGSEVLFPPRPDGGRLLVVTAAQDLLAIEPSSGGVILRRPLPGRATSVPDTGPEGTVLVGTDHGMLLALAGPGLEVRWRRYLGHAITSPPLQDGGRIYVATADRRVACLRRTSGKVLWRAVTGAMVAARPFVLGRWLYLLCFDDDIYVLSARRGHLLGRVRMGHRLVVDGALSGGHLFVAPDTEGVLHALALPGLQSAGKYALDLPGEWFTSTPIVLGERLAIGYGRLEGRLLALDVAPGRPNPAPAAAPPPSPGAVPP